MRLPRWPSITPDDILALQENKVRESRHLEYKREVPALAEHKEKFLDSVCALANTDGGHILIGVEEDRDERDRKLGYPRAFPGVSNSEELRSRANSWLKTGVERRIPGLLIETLVLPTLGANIVVVEVPRSWQGPHRTYTNEKTSRFCYRTSESKGTMDIEQIRLAFLGGASLLDRADSGSSLGDWWTKPDDAGAVVHIHVRPAAAILGGAPRIPLRRLAELIGELVVPSHSVPSFRAEPSVAFNVGRVIAHLRHEYSTDQSCSICMSSQGDIAVADWTSAGHWRLSTVDPECAVIIVQRLELALMQCCSSYLKALAQLGIGPPAVISVSFTGLRPPSRNMLQVDRSVADRLGCRPTDSRRAVTTGSINLPSIEVESFSEPPEIALRPLFDHIWNAFGYSHCQHFDDEGRYLLPK